MKSREPTPKPSEDRSRRASVSNILVGFDSLRFRSQSLDPIQHFVVLREAPDVMFAPDLRAVDVHVEDSAGAFDHLRIYAELILDRLRQTGGRGVIVSLHAVFDADVHCRTTPHTPVPGRRAGPSLVLQVRPLRKIHRHQELGVGADLAELRAQQLDRLHDVHVG